MQPWGRPGGLTPRRKLPGGGLAAGSGHPGFTLVSSNQVPVTWWEFIIRGGGVRR